MVMDFFGRKLALLPCKAVFHEQKQKGVEKKQEVTFQPFW